MSDQKGFFSSVTEDEAKEVHKWFLLGTTVFTGIALVAHLLVWNWRPWFPG